MRLTLFLIMLGINFSAKLYGQKVPHSAECKELNSSFKVSLNKQDFHQSALLFNSVVSSCPEEEVTILPTYLAFLKKQISSQQNLSLKEQMIDSLESIYLRMEAKQLYSTSEDIQRATYLINSPNSSNLKLDELLNRIIHSHAEGCSETLIMMYYINLNALYSSRQGDLKHEFWKRMVNDYYYITNTLSIPNISSETQKTLHLYYSNITSKCTSIAESTPYCISTLSTNDKKRASELNYYISIYEKVGCINAPEYNQLLDSLNALDFSNYIFLKKATYYRLNKDYSKEFSALYFAKNANSDVHFTDSIQLLEARCMFNMGNYSEAFKLGIKSSSTFPAELREIAIQAVLSENGLCVQDEKQKTFNLIYAHVLIMDAKRSKLIISATLEDTVSKQQPNAEKRQQLGIISGQTAYLECWQISFKIP